MTPMIARASLQVFLIADILFSSSIAPKGYPDPQAVGAARFLASERPDRQIVELNRGRVPRLAATQKC
jgi:hypothetical protein